MKNFIERWKNRNCEKGEFKTLFNKKNNPDNESGLFNLSRKKYLLFVVGNFCCSITNFASKNKNQSST